MAFKAALAGFNRIIKKCPNCGRDGPKELVGTDKSLMAMCPHCQHVFHPYRRWGCGTVIILCFGVIALVSLCINKSEQESPVPATPAPRREPRAAASPKIEVLPVASPRPELVAASRARALKEFPDLGIANTRLNAEFVSRYRRLESEHNRFLADPDWPLILTRNCAHDLGISPK